MIIHYHKDRPYVFLTKRSSSLKLHTGEISFPGGRYVESDGTFLATALRETAEEVGIAFTIDQVIGCLSAVRTDDIKALYCAVCDNPRNAASIQDFSK